MSQKKLLLAVAFAVLSFAQQNDTDPEIPFEGYKVTSQQPIALYEEVAYLFACAEEGGQCQCDGQVYYVPRIEEAGITLPKIKEGTFAVAETGDSGRLTCDTDTFFDDVAPG